MTEQEAQALIREGEGIDQGAAAHAEAAAAGNLDEKGQIITPPDPMIEKAAQWLIVPQMLAWAITAAMPETAAAYTPEKQMELARAFVPVADKYGWDGIGDAPELTLVMCSVAFCAPGFMAYKARKAAADAAAKAAKAEKGETFINPINGTVT
jgi:hypothetical protein